MTDFLIVYVNSFISDQSTLDVLSGALITLGFLALSEDSLPLSNSKGL